MRQCVCVCVWERHTKSLLRLHPSGTNTSPPHSTSSSFQDVGGNWRGGRGRERRRERLCLLSSALRFCRDKIKTTRTSTEASYCFPAQLIISLPRSHQIAAVCRLCSELRTISVQSGPVTCRGGIELTWKHVDVGQWHMKETMGAICWCLCPRCWAFQRHLGLCTHGRVWRLSHTL